MNLTSFQHAADVQPGIDGNLLERRSIHCRHAADDGALYIRALAHTLVPRRYVRIGTPHRREAQHIQTDDIGCDRDIRKREFVAGQIIMFECRAFDLLQWLDEMLNCLDTKF